MDKVFYSVEDLKEFLASIPEDCVIKLSVEMKVGEDDGEDERR